MPGWQSSPFCASLSQSQPSDQIVLLQFNMSPQIIIRDVSHPLEMHHLSHSKRVDSLSLSDLLEAESNDWYDVSDPMGV